MNLSATALGESIWAKRSGAVNLAVIGSWMTHVLKLNFFKFL